jgi:hypothetical protein
MANASLEEVVLDAPFHQIVAKARLRNGLELGDCGLIVSFESGEVL